jgi:hypothetical protein
MTGGVGRSATGRKAERERAHGAGPSERQRVRAGLREENWAGEKEKGNELPGCGGKRGGKRWAGGNRPGSAHVERGEKKRGPRERGVLGWAGRLLGWAAFYSFFFPFLFLYSTIQTILLEFKYNFEFKSIHSTQIKQCCGMNAQTL